MVKKFLDRFVERNRKRQIKHNLELKKILKRNLDKLHVKLKG